jgi:hypothetical protein
VYQGWIRSRIDSQWHLLWREDGVVELYDWLADPQEKNNLARMPEAQSILKRLAHEAPGFPRL